MLYATKNDVVNRFPDIGDAVDLGSNILDLALLDVSAEIDTYIKSLYIFEIGQIPSVLTAVACDMARYKIYSDDPIDIVIERNKAALIFLRNIATGIAKLDIAKTGNKSDANIILTNGGGQMFDDKSMAGF